MSPQQASELIRDTLLLAMIISSPMLIIGLIVGIIISLMQALTQIQEQTLTFIPKIVSMVIAAVVLMPWMSHRLMLYAFEMFTNGHVH
jgi:flagellar biosynthesis protein FliQ